MAAENADPLNVMIAGAPASGKGTQCELIKAKVSYCELGFSLVHDSLSFMMHYGHWNLAL